ncbi:MAG TPA: hypothetical protein VNT03_09645 [Baekduia sp.]|nr:hypothetical protein [Baekduia sp.]
MFDRFRLLSMMLACCSALALALAGAASGAVVAAGPGSLPHIEVDADGAGYLTWVQGDSSAFRYCKLPATATACTAPFSYADTSQDVEGGYALLPGDGRVLLVDARGVSPQINKLLWTSTDGGMTFGAPTQIAGMAVNGANIGAGALYVRPGMLGLGAESIFTLGKLQGSSAAFQASGVGPSTATATADLAPSVSTSLAVQGDTLLVALSDFNQLSWSRYAGPVPATPETLNAAANWTAPALIGPRYAAQLETRLVAGPGGIYVGYAIETGPARDAFVVRRFDGTGWGAPQTIATDIDFPDLYEDPSGRLHAIWADPAGLHYTYATNTTNTAWSEPQTVSTGDNFAFARLAVNAAGNGWAAWAGGTGVKAIPLHGTYSGPQTTVETSGSGASYTLGVPKSCVSPGQRFRVTLTWKRQRRKGNLFVKVKRADFYLGTSRVRIDTKVPFVHTYDVRVTQRPGSTLRLRARAFIKVKHGKTPKKSIIAKVKVCS